MGLQIRELITFVDFFGQGIELTIDKKVKSKTVIGGILSITLVMLLTAMFILYADDLLYQKNPQTSNEIQMLITMPNITLSTMTFPISVSMTNSGNFVIYKPDFFKYEVNYMYGLTTDPFLNAIPLKVMNCTKDHFPLISNESYDMMNMGDFMCIENQNITISGSWAQNYISYLSMKISLCINRSPEDKCAPVDDLMAFIFSGTYFWKIYYQDTNINSQERNDPISYMLKNYYKLMKMGSYKIVEIFVREQTLSSDEGFMFKSKTSYDSIAFDFDKFDDGTYDESTHTLVEFKFLVSPNRYIFHRTYLKIQTVLASVGGLASLLKLSFTLICYTFSVTNRNEILMNKIFDFDIRGEINSKNFSKSELLRKLKKIQDVHKKKIDEKKAEIDFKFGKIDRNKEHALPQNDCFSGPISSRSANKDDFTTYANTNPNNTQKSQKTLVQNYKLKQSVTFNLTSGVQSKLSRSSRFEKRNTVCNNILKQKGLTHAHSAFIIQTLQQETKKDSPDKSLLNESISVVNGPTSKNIMRRIEIRNRQKKLTFSFLEIIRSTCCLKMCQSQSLRIKKQLYHKSTNVIQEFMDISFIITKLEEFEKMKIVMFNSEQLALFNFLSKELITLNKEKSENHFMNKLKNLNKNKDHLVNMIMKFKEKMARNEAVEKIDRKLYNLIYDEFK
jgi:hypothetical protein